MFLARKPLVMSCPLCCFIFLTLWSGLKEDPWVVERISNYPSNSSGNKKHAQKLTCAGHDNFFEPQVKIDRISPMHWIFIVFGRENCCLSEREFSPSPPRKQLVTVTTSAERGERKAQKPLHFAPTPQEAIHRVYDKRVEWFYSRGCVLIWKEIWRHHP